MQSENLYQILFRNFIPCRGSTPIEYVDAKEGMLPPYGGRNSFNRSYSSGKGRHQTLPSRGGGGKDGKSKGNVSGEELIVGFIFLKYCYTFLFIQNIFCQK